MYKIELAPQAVKFLKNTKIPAKDIDSILSKIRLLAENPMPSGNQKLTAAKGNYYRIRTGNYRIIYEVKNNELIIVVVYIGNRKDIYRKF